NRNEDDEGFVNGFGDVRGKADPVLANTFCDEFRDPWLIEGDITLLKSGDPCGVCVHAGDVDTELRKTGSCDQSDITGSNHADMHEGSSSDHDSLGSV